MADIYIKQELKRMFKYIAKWKGLEIKQWHIGDEHIHLYIAIPPKYSISYIIQVMKGKTSSWLKKKKSSIPKGSYWARGYFVTTLGVNEIAVRKYIENQEKHKYEIPKLF